jgi:hypothetical protein
VKAINGTTIAKLATHAVKLVLEMTNGIDFHVTTQDMIFMNEAHHVLNKEETGSYWEIINVTTATQSVTMDVL